VVVVGLGKSGRSAARLALARGADVVGVDRDPRCRPLEADPDVALPSEAGNAGAGDGGSAGEVAGDKKGGTGGVGAVVGGQGDVAGAGRILRTELGPHQDATFAAAEIVVLSPGVPLTQPQVAAALRGHFDGAGRTVQVISELAFAAQCLPQGLPIAAGVVTRPVFGST
jgi:UDP-N-acetylmuramoylalanine-D-glutamate ligase